MEYYVTQPKDYWIAPNAVSITLNALGEKNRIQGSVASGAVIMCFIEDIKAESAGGEPGNGDGLWYGANHEPKRWPLSLSPTYFNSDTRKYVYVAIPRSTTVGSQAVIVFPSEKLDIYGRVLRLTDDSSDDSSGEDQYVQVGSTDYFYVYLQGIIGAADAVVTGARRWDDAISDRDWGILETAQGRDEQQISSEWYTYSTTNQTVTFLKKIFMSAGSWLQNLIIGSGTTQGTLTGVATDDNASSIPLDSKQHIVTPSYLDEFGNTRYLSKIEEDTAAEQIGFLKGLWVKVKGLFGIDADGNAKVNGLEAAGDGEVKGSLTVSGVLTALLAKINSISSTDFSGHTYTGQGWAITNNYENGRSRLTVDELYVRARAIFEELVIKQKQVSGGDTIESCAASYLSRVDYLDENGSPMGYTTEKVPWTLNGVVRFLTNALGLTQILAKEVRTRRPITEEELETVKAVRCYFLASDGARKIQNWWQVGDLAFCQTLDLDPNSQQQRDEYAPASLRAKYGNIRWWRRVYGVSSAAVTLDDGKQYHYFDVKYDYEAEGEASSNLVWCELGSDIPAANDAVVQLGHIPPSANDQYATDRMNALSIEINGAGNQDAPCVKILYGIYTYDLTKCWFGGLAVRMKLSPKTGYDFYGPSFHQVTMYDTYRVPTDRGLWTDITPSRDDYGQHANVRKCYFYDRVGHVGSLWLCRVPEGQHWTDASGNYISDLDYAAMTVEQQLLCTRVENYTTEEPGANAQSTVWEKQVEKGEKGTGIRTAVSSYARQTSAQYDGAPPDSGWQPTIAALGTINNGDYVWTRTVITYSDTLQDTTTYSVVRWGVDGNGIADIETKFYEHASLLSQAQLDGTADLPDGSRIAENDWKEYSLMPLSNGDYIYTRTKITYDEGDTPTVSYQVNRIGQDGVGYVGTEEYYCLGNSMTTPPTGHPYQGTDHRPDVISPATMASRMSGGSWSEARPAYDTSTAAGRAKKYLWNFEAGYTTNASEVRITEPVCIANYEKGISSIVETYTISAHSTKSDMLEDTAERSVHPWVDEAYDSAPTASLRYQWNRTVTTYSDGSSDTFYHISAVRGSDGASITRDGADTYRYATNNTGTRPTDSQDWSTTKPTLEPGYWLYTETTVHWSDGSTTVFYTDERNPNDGVAGQDIVNGTTTITYCVSDTNTQPADSSFHTYDASEVVQGKWLWSKATTPYYKANDLQTPIGSSSNYNVSYISKDGRNGNNGNGISSVTKTYGISASGTTASDTTAPSDITEWSAGSPAATVARPYLWMKEVTTFTYTSSTTKYYCIGRNGDNGVDAQDVEFVYVRTTENVAPTIVEDTTTPQGYKGDDYKPLAKVGSGRIKGGTEGDANAAVRCTDDPQGVNDTWKYEWEIKRTKGAADASGKREWNNYTAGDAMTLHNNLAESALIIDVDNDSAQFGTDSTGRVLSQQQRVTNVTMMYGTEEQDFTSKPTATLKYDDGTEVNDNSVATVNVSKATNKQYSVMVVVMETPSDAATMPFASHGGLYVDIKGTCAKGDKTIRFTLEKVMSGEPGVSPTIYQLNLSQKSLSYGRDNSNNLVAKSNSLTVGVKRTIGDTTTFQSLSASGRTCTWGFDGTYNTYTVSTSNPVITVAPGDVGSHTKVSIKLSTGDKEEIPITVDGTNGSAGRGITSTNIYYKADTSTPQTPQGAPSDNTSWADDGNSLMTTGNATKHLYESTCTRYTDNTYSWTSPMDDGLISDMAATSEEFALADSAQTAPAEGWATTTTPTAGKWIWSRTKLTFKSGSPQYINTQCIGYCGTNADVWTIGDDGYWYKNGVKQGTKAEGKDGTGVEIEGSVESYFTAAGKTSLQSLDLTDVAYGDCYIVNDDSDATHGGHLYFFLDQQSPAHWYDNWRDVGKIKGEPGNDGTTYYTHFAYADTIDLTATPITGTGFRVDSDGSKAWTGLCVDTNQHDPGSSERQVSNPYAEYEWNEVKGPKGDDGRSITAFSEHYQANNSDTAPTIPSGGSWANEWTTDPNVPDQQGNTQWKETAKYLWNYEKTVYAESDGSTTIVRTTPHIVAIWTKDGAAGKGIDSITNYYQVSNSLTAHKRTTDAGYDSSVDGVWEDNPMAPTAENPYLWNYERITWLNYGNGSQYTYTDPHIAGEVGPQGNGVVSITRTFAVSSVGTTASETTEPSHYGSWTASSPAVDEDHPYLWAKEVVVFTDKTKNTTKYYCIGARGDNGVDAKDVEWAYIRTKTPAAPAILDDTTYTDHNGNAYTDDDHLPHVDATGRTDDIESNNSGSASHQYECTDDPKGVNGTWKYEWEVKRTKGSRIANGHRYWDNYAGTMTLHNNYAESALVIDIDNDNDQFGVDADGKVLVQQTCETSLTMMYGTEEQAFTSAPSVSLKYDDGTPASGNVDSSVATADVTVVPGTDYKEYKITVTVKATGSNSPVFGASGKNGLYVDISGTCAKGTKTTRFTLGKVMSGAKGENPVIYQMMLSQKSFSYGRDASGGLVNHDPATNSVKVSLKVTQGSTSNIYESASSIPSGLTVPTYSWGFENEPSAGAGHSGKAIGTSVSISPSDAGTHTKVWFLMSTGDKEEVPIVKDGAKGTSIKSVVTTYAKQTPAQYDGTAPSSGWQSTIAALGTISDGDYVWTKSVTSYSDTLQDTTTYSVVRWGIDGDGIDNIETKFYENEYLLTQTQLASLSESVWKDTYSGLTLRDGDYIYTRTKITYDKGGTPTVSYSVNRLGEDGVSYVSTEEYYCLGNSNSTPPSGHPYTRTDHKPESMTPATMAARMQGSSWGEARPTYDTSTAESRAKKYLWNFEVGYNTTTNIQVTEPICIANYEKGIASIVETYAISAYDVAPQAGGYPSDISSWTDEAHDCAPTDGKPYQWNKTVTTYTDGSNDIFYHVSAVKGTKGNGIVSITTTYARSTQGSTASETTAPTIDGSWGSTMPTLTDTYKYLWCKEVTVYTDTSKNTTKYRLLAEKGAPGGTGSSAVSVEVEPGVVILTQNKNNTSDFGIPSAGLLLTVTAKAGTSSTNLVSSISNVSSKCNASSSTQILSCQSYGTNQIKITGVNATAVSKEYTEGYITATVNITGYASRSIQIPVALNLLAAFKRSIDGDIEQALVSAKVYVENPSGTGYISTVANYENWNSAYESVTTLSEDVEGVRSDVSEVKQTSKEISLSVYDNQDLLSGNLLSDTRFLQGPSAKRWSPMSGESVKQDGYDNYFKSNIANGTSIVSFLQQYLTGYANRIEAGNWYTLSFYTKNSQENILSEDFETSSSSWVTVRSLHFRKSIAYNISFRGFTKESGYSLRCRVRNSSTGETSSTYSISNTTSTIGRISFTPSSDGSHVFEIQSNYNGVPVVLEELTTDKSAFNVYINGIDTSESLIVDGNSQSISSSSQIIYFNATTGDWVRHTITFKTASSLGSNKYFSFRRNSSNVPVCIYHPRLEVGTTANEYGDEKSGLRRTGIDIEKGKITAFTDNFEIQNSRGDTTFSIDQDGNIIGAGDASFEGTIKSKNFYHSVLVHGQENIYYCTDDNVSPEDGHTYPYVKGHYYKSSELDTYWGNTNLSLCTGSADIIAVYGSGGGPVNIYLPIASDYDGKLVEIVDTRYTQPSGQTYVGGLFIRQVGGAWKMHLSFDDTTDREYARANGNYEHEGGNYRFLSYGGYWVLLSTKYLGN